MKKIFILLTLLLSISLISAIEINAGESFIFELGEVYSYYEVTGNSTIINLNVSQNGNSVTILFDKYTQDDNFTIIFYNEKDEVIISSSSSGGGGGSSSSRTKYVIEYKEIPTYITEYVNEIIEKEIPNEIEIEVIKNKVPIWILIFTFLCILLVVKLLWKLYSMNNQIRMKGSLDIKE